MTNVNGSNRPDLTHACYSLLFSQDCDEIVVLHNGQVVERGTHNELLRLGGRYTNLLKMQETIIDDDQ